MESSTNKVLITGCAGFIFTHVTEYFLKKGWHVIGLDDLVDGSHKDVISQFVADYPNFTFIKHDCADLSTQDLIIKWDPHYIVHAAAISDVDFSIKDPEFTLKQNILANINVFEASRFVRSLKKLLYVSTDEVYGECEEQKNESDIIFPKNPYSASKAVGSLLRLAYDNTYLSMKRKTCETRFCNVFGPRQDTRKILPLIKKSLEEGDVIPVQNGGKGYREYIYVKNIPPIIEMLLEKGWRTYNVTLNDGFTVEELIQRAEQVTGRKVRTTESFRPGMDLKYQMDGTRLKEEFDWRPLYTFDEALTEYLNAPKYD